MRIVMTYVVRNEGDVLDLNLRVHRALGVDAFAVLDNGSTDATAEILERWRAAGLAHVISDPEADSDEVFRSWQTRLARLAATDLGADWVINNDADEFWYPVSGDLKTTFAELPPEVHGLLAPRIEFVPRPEDDEPFWRRMTLREAHTRVLPKLAHRASTDINVGPGSHHVSSPSLGIAEAAGKPSLRGLRVKPRPPELIAPSPRFPCAIFHLPLRSFEQYRSRLEIGMRIAKTRQSSRLEQRIERIIAPDRAATHWRQLVVDDERAAAGLEAGDLVTDNRLRDLVEAIGPAGEGALEPPRYEASPSSTERDAALAELEREALTGIAHNHAQALGERDSLAAKFARRSERLEAAKTQVKRQRRKLADKRNRVDRLERRLKRIERSRWWRLRPRRPGR